MKIVIAGAGEVGSHLAKLLSIEEQDITLIDEDSNRLAVLDANFNLMTVNGDPTSFAVLREAKVDNCDMFIGVMPYETANIVSCSIAKQLGAQLTVARIDSYDYMKPENFCHVKQMGVDKVIYPEYLAAREIITSLEYSWMRSRYELHEGQIILAGIPLPEDAPIAGMQLKDFASSNHYFHVSAIRRNHETIIPGGLDRLLPGDVLYFTTTSDHVNDLKALTGLTERKIRRVMIMGGGKLAMRLTNLAEGKFRFKILENDLNECNKLSRRCPADVEIINGDARDVETLLDSGISEMDAFVTLTPSSESNILTCLTARELTDAKIVAEVENIQFIDQAEALNIDLVINKKLLASSAIFQLLLDADSSTAKCLALADAEVAEMEVREGSKVTHAPVKDLRLSRDMTLGGLIRDGKGMLIGGNTQILPGDHVLVFCLNGALRQVERLFN
ncbi:MAG: Trk system potassium transporter TrkA [Muribaculaceae bacterium]|nr:Trk system potassium transporter TrkA [Muribaculaceae bacterium]